ncbi:hypothetical protein [Streptomyces specialis]|uniref:hypothetical protein n=1 Tax=Streptomyces specialis TaxID=498367 RepID=UPI000A6431A5|nr:hypothetical protein [Streptomyces specialis]
MNIRGVSLSTFYDIVDDVSRSDYAGNVVVNRDARWSGRSSITARLRVTDSRGLGARTAASGRHGPYACWHAYRDVLRQVFAVAPDATVRTVLETYRGEPGFRQNYPATAYRNVGSRDYPAYMPELCVRAGCGQESAPVEWPPPQTPAPDLDGGDVLERINRELRQADRMRPQPLVFEGPESLLDAPDLAYSGR